MRRAVQRQLLADQVVSRLAERIAIPARPVEPPVFPVLDPHPHGSVGPDKLGLDANAVPLQLVDRDLASHFGADGRTATVDFQFLHVQRKHDVAFGEIIQAPCAEQLGEVIDDDQVGVKRRRLPVLDQRLQGEHSQASLDSFVGKLAHVGDGLKEWAVE